VAAQAAVLGGVHGSWEAPADPLPDVWVNDGFALTDFAHLASFLARSSPPQADLDRRLQTLLEGSDDGHE
jgi:hypothetical protein